MEEKLDVRAQPFFSSVDFIFLNLKGKFIEKHIKSKNSASKQLEGGFKRKAIELLFDYKFDVIYTN